MSSYISPTAKVAESAIVRPNVCIEDGARVSDGVVLGDGTYIAERAEVGRCTHTEAGVIIGAGACIREGGLILAGAQVCPNPVEHPASTDARKLLERATIGQGVLLHDEVELSWDAIIPTQETIVMLGNLGFKRRVVTIYASDYGPRYSIGCQMGVSLATIKKRVGHNSATTAKSAGTYAPYLGIFGDIGNVVQKAYDRETRLVDELKDQRRTLGI
jgi:UDP-3-O-[3-hydroxymyristoyl] glucosamine N-acyltransferase